MLLVLLHLLDYIVLSDLFKSHLIRAALLEFKELGQTLRFVSIKLFQNQHIKTDLPHGGPQDLDFCQLRDS